MRVTMDIERRGTSYVGCLAREGDDTSFRFSGVLELLAALERLDPEAPPESGESRREPDGGRA